jgi:hypothetical protein
MKKYLLNKREKNQSLGKITKSIFEINLKITIKLSQEIIKRKFSI